MVVHAYSTWEAESEDLEFEDSLGYIVKLVFETKITVEKKTGLLQSIPPMHKY